MKSIILISVLLAASATAFVAQSDDIVYEQSEEWAWIPNAEGVMELHNMKELQRFRGIMARSDPLVGFHLFTNKNPTEGDYLILDDPSSIDNSNFDPRNPTRILIHGWRNNATSKLNLILTKSYLEKGDYNVIVVDWSSAAMTYNYLWARDAVEPVASIVARLIEMLYQHTKFSFEDLYMIGHSLGAHVCGLAGKEIQSGKIKYIVGLDPALPLFLVNHPQTRLNATDAEYVQIIHTNAGVLGYDFPIGHASFYPNWGRKQPGCGFDPLSKCSHGRSIEYFAESIVRENAFQAIKCSDYQQIKNKDCIPEDDQSIGYLGGEPLNREHNGVYFLTTGEESPYGFEAPPSISN